jgi:Transglutaminase-like superfamily
VAHDHTSGQPGILGARVPRRTFLGVAGLSVAGILGARAALAGTSAGTGAAGPVADSLAANAIDDLAFALDYDLARIFRYVADEIWYDPYGGILRGANGTLESRAGNSADKGLLLAALLEASVIPYRFVIGTLDDAAADALWTHSQVDATTLQDHAAAVLTQAPAVDGLQTASPAPVAPAGTLQPGGQAIVDAIGKDPLPIIATATSMLDSGVQLVQGALQSGGIAIPAAADGLPDLERSQYVWVQAKQGADWIDLDPGIKDQDAATALGTPVTGDLATLPDELRHRVETRVIVERVLGTGLEQVVILEHAASADSLGGQPMALLHITPDGMQGAGITIGNALQGVDQYQPVLQVGDATHVGMTGVQLAAADNGGAAGAFGGGGHDGEATAEWLETTVTSPDGRTSTVRRILFDRIGSQVRATGVIDPTALPEMPRTRLTAQDEGVYPPLLAVHFLAVATGATSSTVLAGVDPDDDSPWGLRIGPHAYHLSRDSANATAGLTHGVRIYHDAPNVTRYVVELPAGVSDGSFTATLDVLTRNFAAVPVVGAQVDPAPGIVAGVLSHVAERLAFGAASPDGSAADDTSVGTLLDLAAAQGIPVRTFAAGDDLTALPFAPDALDLLKAALASGWVAIAPERTVDLGGSPRIGWYLFDPVTGALTDQMDSGNGQTMSEYAGLVGNLWRAYGAYVRLGICVALIIKELKTLLELTSGGSPFSLATGLGAGAVLGGVHKWACH